MKRINDRKPFMFCGECGGRIKLSASEIGVELSRDEQAKVEHEAYMARLRTVFESALVRVKAVTRDAGIAAADSSCFISYAWGNANHERWVLNFATDLLNSGIRVIVDQRDSLLGTSVARFVSRIDGAAYVIAVGTPLYREKAQNTVSERGSVLAAEVDLLQLRLTGPEESKSTVIPVLLEGDPETSFPPLLQGRVYADFRSPEQYFAQLFDVILKVQGIPSHLLVIRELRDELRLMSQGGGRRAHAQHS